MLYGQKDFVKRRIVAVDHVAHRRVVRLHDRHRVFGRHEQHGTGLAQFEMRPAPRIELASEVDDLDLEFCGGIKQNTKNCA